MIPVVPNPKEPWKVDSKQLQRLDDVILACFPNAKLTEGVKYARWAQVDDQTSLSVFSQDYAPDNIFEGRLMGKDVKIMMWLSLFN